MANLNIKFPMQSGGYGFPRMNITSKTATRENLKNVFLTLPKQRLIKNNVGSTLRLIVFDTSHDLEKKEKMKNEVRRVFIEFFPEYELVRVIVNSHEDDQTIDLYTYVIQAMFAPQGVLSQADTIKFTLNGTNAAESNSTLDQEYLRDRQQLRDDESI